MKELTILLVFCNLIIFTYSGPDPEINLHVHLPPEEGTSVWFVWVLLQIYSPQWKLLTSEVESWTIQKKVRIIQHQNIGLSTLGAEEEALEVHHPNTETKSGPTEAPKGITSPPMKSKVVFFTLFCHPDFCIYDLFDPISYSFLISFFLLVFDTLFLPRWWRRRRTRKPTRRSALRWRGSWISNPLFPVEITMSRDVKIVFRVQTVLLQHPLCEWISLISAPLRLKMRFCC